VIRLRLSEQDVKATAAGLLLRHPDLPALVRADPLDQRKPEAQPLAAGLLAAHEGQEDALALFLGDARAAVLDAEAAILQD